MLCGYLAKVLSFTLVIGALLLAGCNGDGSAQEVTGTVTLDGQPLKVGKILFEGATSVGADIVDGKFTTRVPTGNYKVRITSTREDGVAADGLPKYVSDIPKQYNDESTLEEEVKSGKNEFKFELTK